MYSGAAVAAMTWTVRNVRGDGSCFFRALYQASLRTGSVMRIIRRFRRRAAARSGAAVDAGMTEDGFVAEVRAALAAVIMKDTAIIPAIHENLRKVYKEKDHVLYNVILESYPEWFQERFASFPKRLEVFRARLAKQVAWNGNWVSEIEVRLILDTLRGIPIKILPSVPPSRTKLDPATMYLVNVDEVHYTYIAMNTRG